MNQVLKALGFIALALVGTVWSQGFGNAVGMSAISEGILKFSLYGKEWVDIEPMANTGDSAAIGSDGWVRVGSADRIRGDILAAGEVIGANDDTIDGNVSANGKVAFGYKFRAGKSIWAKDSLVILNQSAITGSIFVGKGLRLDYYDTIRGLTTVANGVIPVAGAWPVVFGMQSLSAPNVVPYKLASATNTGDSLKWNTPFTRPAQWNPVSYSIPSTIVDTTGTKNCVLTNAKVWDNTAGTCILVSGTPTLQTAPDGAKVLPPGNYGDIDLRINSKLVLGEGIYNFKSLIANENLVSIPVWQPTGGRTQILVQGDIKTELATNFMLRPASNAADYLQPYNSTTNEIKGGSILLYSNSTNSITLNQGSYIWATVIAPKALIQISPDVRLFGQALGKQILVKQGFKGNTGKYIPFYPSKPTIRLNPVSSTGILIPEGSGGGTKVFPINFTMDHENGMSVTVYFHTESRLPATNGNADASDYTGVAKDSVTFGVGVVSLDYSKITINKDGQYEVDDWFDLVIDSVKNGDLDPIHTYALGIENDDAGVPPTITPILDQASGLEDVTLGPLGFSIGDDPSVGGILAVTALGNNSALFPADSIILSGSGSSRTITLKPMKDQFGTAQIIVKVQNQLSLFVLDTFNVTISSVNDAPSFIAGPNDTILEGFVGERTIAGWASGMQIGPANEVGQTFSFALTNSNPGIFKTLPAVDATGKLTYELLSLNVNGVDSVSIQMKDNGGTAAGGEDLSSVQSFKIVVTSVNDAPTLVGLLDTSVNEDDSVSVNFTVADMETATSSLTVSATSSDLTKIPNANLTLSGSAGSRTIKIKPGANQNGGPVTVTLTVSDGVKTTSKTFNVTITPVNDAPVAIGDNIVTDLNVTRNIPVDSLTLNDSDVDGNALTVTAVTSGTGTHGSVSLNAGVVTYIPQTGYQGPASFAYSITDGAITATATVGLLVGNWSNTIPTLSGISAQFATQNIQKSIALQASDPDTTLGDILSYSFVSGNLPGMFLNAGTGVITWTPINSQVGGPYTVQVRVSDLVAPGNTVPVSITVLNAPDAPVLDSILDQDANENQEFTYQVRALDVDQSVDPLESLTYSLVLPPAGMVIDVAGNISWTPDNGDLGVHTVKVVVRDLGGLADTAVFALTVVNVNDRPSLDSIADQETFEDSLFSYTVVGHDVDQGVDILETLVYSLVYPPVGMQIDSVTGTITWTPGIADVGMDSIKVRATDEKGLYSERTFALNVNNVNHSPTLSDTTFVLSEAAKPGAIVGRVIGKDMDANSILTYELVGNNPKFSVDVDGTIVLVQSLDYETSKAETLWVSVTDGFVSVSKKVIISLGNVKETSFVEIIEVATADSTWAKPDTIWTNDSLVDITWTHDGITQIDRFEIRSGLNVFIREFKGPGMDTYGRDTLYVLVSRKTPEVLVMLPPERPEPKPNTVIEDPLLPVELTLDGDTIFYINDAERAIFAQVIVIGKDMKRDTLIIQLHPDLQEGLNSVDYTYTDLFGNTATGSVTVFLDLTPPVVDILKPADSTQTVQFVSPVQWTVDGIPMDTLNQQSLVVDWNMIIRTYRDRAGNEGSDTVWIKLKDSKKNIRIALEEPLVILDNRKVADYYAINPPKDGEFFSFSIVNTRSGQEEEKQYGMGSSTKKGDDQEPYPGLRGKHLGPTLRIDIRLPAMGGVDEAGNLRGGDLQSLMESDGRIALTDGAGEDRKLVSLGDYVENYCLDGAFKGLSPVELSGASLFKARIYIEVMIYDAIGQFVDNMKVEQEISNADYLSDGGMLTGYLEIKPRKDKGLQSQTGRAYGTGAFVVSGKVRSISTLQCDTPASLRGTPTRNSDDVMIKFGYRRDKK